MTIETPHKGRKKVPVATISQAFRFLFPPWESLLPPLWQLGGITGNHARSWSHISYRMCPNSTWGQISPPLTYGKIRVFERQFFIISLKNYKMRRHY